MCGRRKNQGVGVGVGVGVEDERFEILAFLFNWQQLGGKEANFSA